MNVPAELLYSAEHEWARPLEDVESVIQLPVSREGLVVFTHLGQLQVASSRPTFKPTLLSIGI